MPQIMIDTGLLPGERHLVFVADENGQPVEIGTFILINKYPGCIEVWSVEVYPEFRQKGYGRQILQFIEKVATSTAKNKIWLRVDKGNVGAINLYLSEGYLVVRERLEDYEMEKQLT